MRESMRALVARGWDEAPEVESIAVPKRAEGESLIRLEAAVVSHLDLTVLGGGFSIRPTLPYVGGVEGAGVVVESDHFAHGSRVAIRGGGVGLTRSGAWAEFAAVPDSALRIVSSELSPAIAATSFSPLTTAHIALNDVGRLGTWDAELGADREVVGVTGAGGAVGAVAVQLALRAGARVLAFVSRPESAASVPAGAEVVVLSDADAVADLAARKPISLMIDTIGGDGLVARCAWIRGGGRVAIVGYTAGAQAMLDLPNWLFSDVSLLPVNLLRREAAAVRVIDALNERVAKGEITLGVETFGFDDAASAFERLRSGRARGKVALIF